MKKQLFHINVCYLLSVCLLINSAKANSLTDTINVLKLLVDHPQIYSSQLNDIDGNQKIHIPEALDSLCSHAQLTGYEVYDDDNINIQFLKKNGIAFAHISEINGAYCLRIHPDGIYTHHGFSWMLIPFIDQIYSCKMFPPRILNTGIQLSFLGSIFNAAGTFNLNVQISYNRELQSVSGEVNAQVSSNTSQISLFEIKSTYLESVLLVDPPNQEGTTGNFQYVQISGRDGEMVFNDYWIPKNKPQLTKDGMKQMLIIGNHNLAKENQSDMQTAYPDLDITFDTSVQFKGVYDLNLKNTPGAENISIVPDVMISSENYRFSFVVE